MHFSLIFEAKSNESFIIKKKNAWNVEDKFQEKSPELQLESCLFTAESWNRGTEGESLKEF